MHFNFNIEKMGQYRSIRTLQRFELRPLEKLYSAILKIAKKNIYNYIKDMIFVECFQFTQDFQGDF